MRLQEARDAAAYHRTSPTAQDGPLFDFAKATLPPLASVVVQSAGAGPLAAAAASSLVSLSFGPLTKAVGDLFHPSHEASPTAREDLAPFRFSSTLRSSAALNVSAAHQYVDAHTPKQTDDGPETLREVTFTPRSFIQQTPVAGSSTPSQPARETLRSGRLILPLAVKLAA